LIAVIEGMTATPARYLAMIHADLQHDEAVLRPMLERLRCGVLWEYVVLVLDKSIGRFVPPRLLLFLSSNAPAWPSIIRRSRQSSSLALPNSPAPS
jgi:hypothetical protein